MSDKIKPQEDLNEKYSNLKNEAEKLSSYILESQEYQNLPKEEKDKLNLDYEEKCKELDSLKEQLTVLNNKEMSDEIKNQNPEEELPLSKEQKLDKLVELGVIGNDGKEILKCSHQELDYLIEFNSKKELADDLAKAFEGEQPTKENVEETETIDEDIVPKKKWEDELVKRRTFESDNAILKKQIKGIADTLASLAK